MRICLTFDVEEFTMPADYGIRKHNNETRFSKEGCIRLLEVLKKHKIMSTFFITGYFAEREREIVRMISEHGHEIASHSYSDRNLSGLRRQKLEKSVYDSKKILEKISKQEIRGFRSPHFSMNKHLFGVLEQSGFSYDSSVHPAIVPGHYWNINKGLDPYHAGENKKILEIPVSVIPGLRFPISWLWMRNFGNWISVAGTKANIMKRDVVLYFHPWEFADIPKIKGLPFYITSNTGSDFLKSIDKFIIKNKRHGFGRMDEIMDKGGSDRR